MLAAVLMYSGCVEVALFVIVIVSPAFTVITGSNPVTEPFLSVPLVTFQSFVPLFITLTLLI